MLRVSAATERSSSSENADSRRADAKWSAIRGTAAGDSSTPFEGVIAPLVGQNCHWVVPPGADGEHHRRLPGREAEDAGRPWAEGPSGAGSQAAATISGDQARLSGRGRPAGPAASRRRTATAPKLLPARLRRHDLPVTLSDPERRRSALARLLSGIPSVCTKGQPEDWAPFGEYGSLRNRNPRSPPARTGCRRPRCTSAETTNATMDVEASAPRPPSQSDS